MPVLCEFDTSSIRPWYKPTADTRATLTFRYPFVAPPRLPHGFRQLDVSCTSNIHVNSTLQDVTQSQVNCHITSWNDTTLYSGIDHIFALAPGDVDFLTGECTRLRDQPTSVRIDFERPFVTPPKVIVFFNSMEFDNKYNWRLSTTATNIDAEGFTLNITTWCDTILYSAQACWIAYPEDRKHIFSTSVNTMELCPWDRPQNNHSRRITFGDVEFWKDPAVFVALNSIDIDRRHNLRVTAYVDGVSKTNLVWHIDSWQDTVLYSAGASIIAFN